jgi:hypothetical protein
MVLILEQLDIPVEAHRGRISMFVRFTYSLVSVSAASILFGLVTFEQSAAQAFTCEWRPASQPTFQPPSSRHTGTHGMPYGWARPQSSRA